MSAPAYHAVPKGESAASLQPPPRTPMDSDAPHGLAGPRSTEASEYGPYGRLGRRSQLTPSPATTNYADEPRSASSLSNSAEKLPKSRLSSVTVIDVRERELDDALVRRRCLPRAEAMARMPDPHTPSPRSMTRSARTATRLPFPTVVC